MSSATLSTVTRAVEPSGVIWTWRLRSTGTGIVRLTTCDQNWLNCGQLSMSCAQRFLASEVQATTCPRPYCHSERTGSIWFEISNTWLVGFGVVET